MQIQPKPKKVVLAYSGGLDTSIIVQGLINLRRQRAEGILDFLEVFGCRGVIEVEEHDMAEEFLVLLFLGRVEARREGQHAQVDGARRQRSH